jgi:hypothetical protein
MARQGSQNQKLLRKFVFPDFRVPDSISFEKGTIAEVRFQNGANGSSDIRGSEWTGIAARAAESEAGAERMIADCEKQAATS